MISDVIVGREYDGKRCKRCDSEDIYVIHIVNWRSPNDVKSDFVYCRCDKCKRYVTKAYTNENSDFFENVSDAINAWNNEN